jgi:hypothetical protein
MQVDNKAPIMAPNSPKKRKKLSLKARKLSKKARKLLGKMVNFPFPKLGDLGFAHLAKSMPMDVEMTVETSIEMSMPNGVPTDVAMSDAESEPTLKRKRNDDFEARSLEEPFKWAKCQETEGKISRRPTKHAGCLSRKRCSGG